MKAVRDAVRVFLGIGVGVAAGVHVLTVAMVMPVFSNFLVLVVWQYDVGRNVREPTAASLAKRFTRVQEMLGSTARSAAST